NLRPHYVCVEEKRNASDCCERCKQHHANDDQAAFHRVPPPGRSAVCDQPASGGSAPSDAHFEFGAAAAVHPDAVVAPAPALRLRTGRPADLPHQARAADVRDRAEAVVLVVGLALDVGRLLVAPKTAPALAGIEDSAAGVHGEFGAAAAINPHLAL